MLLSSYFPTSGAGNLIWVYGQEVAGIVVGAIVNRDIGLCGKRESYGKSPDYGVPFVLNFAISMEDQQVAGDPERHWKIVDHRLHVHPLHFFLCQQRAEEEALSSTR